MNPRLRRPTFAVLSLSFALLAGCRAASGLLFEPAATDPLDGYKGSLAEAGISTEMDWGPKQNHLLNEFKTLKEVHKKLEDRVDQLVEENHTLTSRLANEAGALNKEKALRAQAEAETEQLRQRRRDLEARILGLSIEKAKLEQASLKHKIDALSATLDQANAAAAEAAAPPSRGN